MANFTTSFNQGFFHWSLSDSKSYLFSRKILKILLDFTSTIVGLVSIYQRVYSLHTFFSTPLGTVAS